MLVFFLLQEERGVVREISQRTKFGMVLCIIAWVWLSSQQSSSQFLLRGVKFLRRVLSDQEAVGRVGSGSNGK